MPEGFQLEGQGPLAYEQYLVPAFFRQCADRLIDVAPIGPDDRVLDVACGTGIVARTAAARTGARGRIAAVDVNEAMIDFARSMTSGAPGSIEWQVGDVAALPLPDGEFDIAYCQQGLQFFTDRDSALRELRRVLAPGGRVALAVWRAVEHNSAFVQLVDALDRHAGGEAAAMMSAPFAGPDADELRGLVSDAGFDEIRIRIGILPVRFPSPAEFLRQEVVSSPLAGPVGALDAARYAALTEDVERSLSTYIDDDGVTFPMQTWLVTAVR